MNWEKIENVGARIEAVDQREREDILLERIMQISLAYAEKKFQEKSGQPGGASFSETVKEFTPIKNIVLKPVYRLENPDLRHHQEQIDSFLAALYREIDAIHDAGGFALDQIMALIGSKKQIIKEYLGLQDLKEHERSKEELGTEIVSFNVINNLDADADRRYADLEKLGFSPMDHFLEVHIDEFYRSEAANLGPELIKKDFGKVAERIIDQEKETVAILGKSWLLDTPLASRLGFKIIDETAIDQKDFSTWLQFIDRNGEIDQKRFQQFLKTGELPHESLRGYMLTEDFLRRYLPPERRGKVALKEAKPERQEFWYRLQKDIRSINSEWDELLQEKGGFEEFVEKNDNLQKVLDFFSPGDKEYYLAFLKSMYERDIPWSEFRQHQDEKIKELNESLKDIINNDLYREKELIID